MVLLHGRAAVACGALNRQKRRFPLRAVRGWHDRFMNEPVGLTTAGSNGAELAAAVIGQMQHMAGAVHTSMTAEGQGVLGKALLPAALGGALDQRAVPSFFRHSFLPSF